MHRRGVLHGDVRPSSIVLSRAGQVKVQGYGLSLVRPEYKSQIKPDRSYGAPEQSKKGVSEQTDIYGLGATMYHVLTGQPPAASYGPDEERKVSKPVALNARIPGPLNELLINCLRTYPESRPPDMYEVVKTLETMVQKLALKDNVLAGLTAEAS